MCAELCVHIQRVPTFVNFTSFKYQTKDFSPFGIVLHWRRPGSHLLDLCQKGEGACDFCVYVIKNLTARDTTVRALRCQEETNRKRPATNSYKEKSQTAGRTGWNTWGVKWEDGRRGRGNRGRWTQIRRKTVGLKIKRRGMQWNWAQKKRAALIKVKLKLVFSNSIAKKQHTETQHDLMGWHKDDKPLLMTPWHFIEDVF